MNTNLKSLITCFTLIVAFYVTGSGQSLKVFSIDSKNLVAAKQKVKNGDKQALAAYQSLIRDADKALTAGPFTVMNKKQVPSSGDKHDYMSLAPYFWPNPNTPNGLPYIRKDGVHTPETKDFRDKDDMLKMEDAVELLSLAYYFSGDEKYAERCTLLIRTWFLLPATKMNPNVNFGQAVKGENEGRKEGVLETRGIAKVVDALGLIQGSKAWTDADQKGMQTWIAAFLDWMQISSIGKGEMLAANNHGTWYDAQRLSYALFLGKKDLANEICKYAINRLDKQMDKNGNFPKELARTKSLGYTMFVTQAFFEVAKLAEHTDVDLWNAVTPSGKSLKKGIEALAPYFSKEKEWTGQQIEPASF
ncbi:MAG: alginate lyase family protein, partial [Bacteroidota bacterium]|nr:alginate lyase family protein [Bacteroidota bacterium]